MKNKIKLHIIHIVLLSLFTLIAGSVGIGMLVQNTPVINAIDVTVYNAIHNGPHFKLLDIIIEPFNFGSLFFLQKWPAYISLMVIIFLAYMFFFKRSLFWWALLSVIIATVLSSIVTTIDWHFVHRDRPFLHLPNIADEFSKSVWKDWSSFPSGHVRETTLYATLIAAYITPLRWVMVCFVLFIAYSRLYLGAHYPTDVLAGMFVGYLCATISLILSREIQLLLNRQKGGKDAEKPQASNTN